MDTELSLALFNALRGMSFALLGIIVVQVGYIIVRYLGVIRVERRIGVAKAGLLPGHVITLGLSLVAALAEIVYLDVKELGGPGTAATVVNPLILMLTSAGLLLVMQFEHKRYTNLRQDLNRL